MSYASQILADSISPEGVRLTTFEVTFPRFILAEVNTHRMLSRNSASSRAIPTEKLIERVREHPFVPETFNRRVKGMGVGEALDEDAMGLSKGAWLAARARAVEQAEKLLELGVDKSRANRLLEPFMWHTAIITATEWDNFFALRDHPAAQPEFQIVAAMMHEQYREEEPWVIRHGEWHLPLTPDFPMDSFDGDWQPWKKASASRCARVSFDRHTDTEPFEATLARADKLMTAVPPHLSPLEHVARPFTRAEWQGVKRLQKIEKDRCAINAVPVDEAYIDSLEFSGNFRGWFQFRKEIPNEARADRAIEAAAVEV